MKVVSYTEARNGLKTVLDGVIDDADYTIITRRDAYHAFVLSLAALQRIAQTQHMLARPANADHIANSREN